MLKISLLALQSTGHIFKASALNCNWTGIYTQKHDKSISNNPALTWIN